MNTSMLRTQQNIGFELQTLFACKCLVAEEVGELLLRVSADETEMLFRLRNSSHLKASSFLHCF